VASFQSIADTRTPMYISLFAVAVNVGLKLLLFHPFGAAGLAAATATGAWINLLLLMAVASRQDLMRLDWVFGKSAAVTSVAGFALALFALLAAWPAAEFCARLPRFQNESELILLLIGGAIIYALVLGAGLYATGVRLRRSASA
jgi:putative peptidoglycan lipid II flippase